MLGLDGVCEAGERVEAAENERRARQLAQQRGQRLKAESLARQQARKISLEEVFSKGTEGELKELNIVLKADVSGSLEALQDEIAKLPQERIVVDVIHAAPGGITESDVMLAAASDAIIIGFNVRPLAEARKAAEREGVEIRTYSVIYKVTEDLRAAMEGMLEPEEVEEALGQAEVKELFRASRVGHDRRLPGHRRQDHPHRPGASGPRGHRGLDGKDRLAAPLQGQRAGGRGGPRVRGRARGLPGRQGGRRAGAVRDQAGRADARVATATAYPGRVRAYVCVVEVRLHLNDSHDLKGKRKVLHSLKAQLRQRFGAAVAEVDGQDTWQRTTLVCALVGGGGRWDGAPTSWSASSRRVVPDGCAFERDLLSLADIRG